MILLALSNPVKVVLSLGGFLILGSAVGFTFWQRRRYERLRADFKRLRGDFSRANERAAGFRGEKGHILRIVEQDIAAPLGKLSRELEKASAESSSPATASALQEAAGQIERIRRGVAMLTEIQTLEDRSRGVSLATINVGAIVLEAAAATREAAEKKSVRISLPAPTKVSLARGDATLLRKVVAALVFQAIEVSPAAAAVSLSLYQTSDRVLITVSDEGPGAISADPAHVLIQSGDSRPPINFPNTTSPLNLAMAHNLVKAMHGWLWSQSEPGRGTTHVLELPLPTQTEGSPFSASR